MVRGVFVFAASAHLPGRLQVSARRVDYTPEFKKSWDRHHKSGRSDMKAMREVMGMIWEAEPLPQAYRDHELKGEWGRLPGAPHWWTLSPGLSNHRT
ncbi:type II toxin-antitoxin system mRNA interferase toxin, RelE/StbE family [Pseudomonas sp. NPDC087358]|uniref:type II toxin-antitoxin system mRNA interferase toxin, RelE/StbE family n=1 Tax=Pseudomonas sp. NPDC087358 TaxID=3364439 RepID=UPI00384BE8B6